MRSTKKGIYKGIIEAKTIHERPVEIEDRTTLGHFGSIPFFSKNNSSILLISEVVSHLK